MLLSEQDRQTVRTHLAVVTRPVTLLFFTQTFGEPETAIATKQILQEVVALNDHLSLEEANFVLDKDRAAQFGVEAIPAIVLLRDGADTRMRFLGAPAGYEFMSLVEAVVLAGSDDSGLTAESKALIAAHVKAPLDIKVFVTPTCPHCPRAVTLAQRMAVESTLVTATCIEASEFIDLSRRYRVTGVPKTVANDRVEILGALPEESFVRQILEAPSADAGAEHGSED
jgi:glutaredoxin-like protein